MFDLGALELIVIGIVALIVVGPKDLPGMFRAVGQFVGKARRMAREFQRSMEEAADESGIKEAAKGLKDIDNLGLNSATKSAQSYAKSFLDDEEDEAAPAAKPAEKPAASAPQTTAPSSDPKEAEATSDKV